MVGVTLTLSLVAIISTASIATAGVDDASAQEGGAIPGAAHSPVIIPPSGVTPETNLTGAEPHPSHAIRERSAPLPDGQPGAGEPVSPGTEDEDGTGGGGGVLWGQEEVEEDVPDDSPEPEDPLAPKRRTVRNCYRTPYLFTRRSALDKNFMRFGRSGGWALGVEEDPAGASEEVDDESGPSNLMRFQRDRNFIRLGRSTGSNNFIRLGRSSPATEYGLNGGKVLEEGGSVGEEEEENNGGEEVEEDEQRVTRGKLNNFMRFGRNSASRNFIRLGRDQQGDESSAGVDGEIVSSTSDKYRNGDFSRPERHRLDRNFLRFGRGSGNNFMRFGRGPNNNFMRFGRGPNNNFMRFGRGAGNNFMRFGRGAGNNFMRFGRGPSNNFMRFGRGPNNNFMRFGRGSDTNFMRFGRSPSTDLNKNFLRFGRRGSEGDENEGDSFMSRAYRAALDKNFMRFGRSNNKNFIRLGRGPNTNFMRFGRGLEVEEEDDNGIGEQKLLLGREEEKAKEDGSAGAGGLVEIFDEKPTRKTPGDASEVSSRSKRSIHGTEMGVDVGSMFPDSTAEETLKNPYGSPSLVGTSPLSAYLFSPELLMLPSMDSEEAGDGRFRRSRNSNFIRFG